MKEAKNDEQHASKKWLFVWLLSILLPVAILLPLLAGTIRRKSIGNEYPCCAMFSDPEAVARAEHAKSLHWLSNIIVGGSIIAALGLVIVVAILIYRHGILKQWPKCIQIMAKTVLAIIVVPPLFLLIISMSYFVFKNREYYVRISQPPGDEGIYAYALNEIYEFFDPSLAF